MSAIWSKYRVWLTYAGLALLIMVPLLGRGYIQTLDMPWGPRIPTVSIANNAWLLHEALRFSALLIGSSWAQKLLLFLVFILAGMGAHRLAELSPLLRQPKDVAYIAGLLYLFNPFIYTRFVNGQWMVLLGYALLPWALASAWRLMQEPGLPTAVRSTLWAAAVALSSVHAVGFLALSYFVLLVAAGRGTIKKRLVWCGAVVVGWLALNSIWLWPLLNGRSTLALQISSFGADQSHAYLTSNIIAGQVPMTTLLLEGFWSDSVGRYIVPSNLGGWWIGVALAVVALCLTGMVAIIHRRDRLGIALVIMGLIGWYLAMGEAWGGSAMVTHWLAGHVPLYAGYREPQKWLMLLGVTYSYSLAVGAGLISRWVARRQPDARPWIVATFALLPILWTPVMLFGANHQLHSQPYPADWYAVKHQLATEPAQNRVVVLPWHLYTTVSFVGRVIANPAPHFFNQTMVVSDDPEIPGVAVKHADSLHVLVGDRLIKDRMISHKTSQQLQAEHVGYVMLLKENDWRDYGWLDQNPGLQLVSDNPHIRLYKIKVGS